MERHINGAIGDIDDTMIPWEVPHALAYPAMSKALSEASDIPEERIISDIKSVNTRHGTIEYTALVQEMPLFQALPEREKQNLIRIAMTSRREAMKGLDEPFESINVLLHAMVFNGLIQVALSDAPVNLAYLRLKRHDLTGFFDLVAGSTSPDDRLFAPEYRMGKKRYDVPVQTMSQRKPYTDLAYLLQLTESQVSDRYFLWGNSEHSDQGLARRYGMLFYQTHWDRGTDEMRKTLLRYAPERILAANVGLKPSNENQIVTHPSFELVDVNSPLEMLDDLRKRKIIKELPPTAP